MQCKFEDIINISIPLVDMQVNDLNVNNPPFLNVHRVTNVM